MDKIMFKKGGRERNIEISPVRKVFLQMPLVFLSFFLIYNVIKSVDITVKKLGVLSQAESEVDELRLKNIELILEKERVESMDYIETEARDRLNYLKNGDIVFVIPDDTLKVNLEEVATVLKRDEKEVKRSTVEVWYDFFIGKI